MNVFNNFLLGRSIKKESVYAGTSSNISNKRSAEAKFEDESEPKRKKYAKDFVCDFKDAVFDVCLHFADCVVLLFIIPKCKQLLFDYFRRDLSNHWVNQTSCLKDLKTPTFTKDINSNVKSSRICQSKIIDRKFWKQSNKMLSQS